MAALDERKFAQVFGRTLACARADAKLTQEQVAEHLGVFSETISRFERGANWPTIPRLLELAELYNVPVATLLGRGSNRATDIGRTIADQLERLSAEDRTWVGNLLKDLCDRLPQTTARKSTTRARDRR